MRCFWVPCAEPAVQLDVFAIAPATPQLLPIATTFSHRLSSFRQEVRNIMTQSRSFASEKTRLSGVHHIWSLLISCSVSDGEHTRTSSPGLIGAIVVAHPGFEWQTTHFSAKGGNRGKPTRTPQRRPKSAKAHATGGKPKQDPAGHSLTQRPGSAEKAPQGVDKNEHYDLCNLFLLRNMNVLG